MPPRKPYDPKIPENSWGKVKTRAERTIEFLIANPDFDDMPATIEEFLGPGYLDVDRDQNPELPKTGVIRPGVKQALIDIFGTEIDPASVSLKREALFTGGIGIGKTTMASVALAYLVHWVSCLHNPQSYFGLMPGSRIAFMLMSTKDSQAKEVLFGDIKARINHSDWFKKNCLYDPNYKNQLRFPKDIWVLPGNSMETTFEGYNILGGILDEGDSHKVTENKDYAEVGWRTIKARVTSRFTNPKTGEHRGLLIAIGQMKAAEGFMARTKKRMEITDLERERQGKKSRCKVVHMAIWESFGWESYRDEKTGEIPAFYYDVDRKIVIQEGPAKVVNSEKIIKVPMAFWEDFDLDPVQALKDHAGIPPAVDDPFISAVDRIELAQTRYAERYPGLLHPVGGKLNRPIFHEDLRATNSIKRAIHVDIGYASHGDAAALAMAHIPEVVEVNGELKPIIVFDCIVRIKPSGGQQLMLEDLRQLIYDLRDERKFKIGVVTYDGFQSQDSQQILQRKRFNTAELSVDRTKGPYEDLRQAIYERRIEFPTYMVDYNRGDKDKTNIAYKELSELSDTGRKIDHPSKGSKDVADCLAACTYVLMGNDQFRRGSKRGYMRNDVESEDVPTVFGARRSIDAADLGQVYDDELFQMPARSNPFVDSAPNGLPTLEVDPFSALRRTAFPGL